MKDNSYKSAMDKIKCSREFHAQMTKMLTMSDDGFHEYIDTVGHVEVARPGSRRYVVVSAAACIAVCAVGFGFWKSSGNRDIRNSAVEIEGNNTSDNPIILPSAAQPETAFAEYSTSVLPKDVSEAYILIDSIIDSMDRDELKVVYEQSREQNDNRYKMSYDKVRMRNYLVRLRRIGWTKETIEYDEAAEFYRNVYIMNNMSFGSKGILYDKGTSYELFTPANESSQKVFDDVMKEMAISRCRNVEELLTNYHETFNVMSADVDMNQVVSYMSLEEAAFQGHPIYSYIDMEFNAKGKVYFDKENEYYATQMSGKRITDKEDAIDIGFECTSEKDGRVVCLGLANELIPMGPWNHIIGTINDDNWKYAYLYDYSIDSEGFLSCPGDYFGLKPNIIRDYKQFIQVLADSDMDINDEIVVDIDNDENGKLNVSVLMYYSRENHQQSRDSAVGFVMNEEGFITRFVRYEKGELVTSYKLSDIRYEEFEKPELCDYKEGSIVSAYGNGQ